MKNPQKENLTWSVIVLQHSLKWKKKKKRNTEDKQLDHSMLKYVIGKK